jgi:hypothetical protein
MKKIYYTITILLCFGSVILLMGRSFRVTKVPNGSKASCNTCHTNGGGSQLNPFGISVSSKVSPNGTESFWNSEFAALDSDGDGFTNGQELLDPNGTWIEGTANPGDFNLVTNPGDVNSIPTSVLDDLNVFTFRLENNYPNPFNPSTTIEYSIPQNTEYSPRRMLQTTLKVYDILGNEVATLVNEAKQPGNYKVEFNASNLPSGVYFYRIISNDFVETKKMILMK